MELWIRTQDKEKLLVVYELELDCYSANRKDYWTINNYGSTLGTYKSKERALEVLDEIQIEIENYVGTMAQIVYKMPQE